MENKSIYPSDGLYYFEDGGTTKNKEIARIYNVSEQLICNIKKGRNYAY